MKKITKARLIDRLINRFGLVRLVDEDFGLSETVVPTSNIDELSKKYRILKTTGVNTGSTGRVVVFTVPNGKRYAILAIRAYPESSSPTIDGFYVRDPDNALATDDVRIGYFATPTGNASVDPINQWVVMEQGWTLSLNVASAGGTMSVWTYIYEEDAY